MNIRISPFIVKFILSKQISFILPWSKAMRNHETVPLPKEFEIFHIKQFFLYSREILK